MLALFQAPQLVLQALAFAEEGDPTALLEFLRRQLLQVLEEAIRCSHHGLNDGLVGFTGWWLVPFLKYLVRIVQYAEEAKEPLLLRMCRAYVLGQPLPLCGHLPTWVPHVVFDAVGDNIYEVTHGWFVDDVVEGDVRGLRARRLPMEDLHHQL